MEPLLFLLAALTALSLLWFIRTYNRFIRYRNMIEETWSGIDVALKRRSNLIPNLVNATKGYSQHESEVLTRVAEARAASASIAAREDEESRISRSLRTILAVAESYPDLKASTNFLALHHSLDEVEAEIQEARNRYNYAVRRFNTLVESFPSSLVARLFAFERRTYFALELATQRETPVVDFDPAATTDNGKRPPR